MTESSSSLTLLLVEADEQVAKELMLLLRDGGGSDTAPHIVVVPTVAAVGDSRPDGVPACVVLPLHRDSDINDSLVREVRRCADDMPVIALVLCGGPQQGLRAIRQGADDFLLENEVATGQLWRAVSCVMERSRYRRSNVVVSWNSAAEPVFDASLEQQASERRQTRDDLAAALTSEALEVHYQPVIDISDGRLVGIEALARWQHPTRGWIPPADFVPLAEDTDLVAALDAYVLQNACADAAKLRAWGVLPEDGYVAVNMSARNVGDGGLVARVREAATAARWPLDRLELEVTETGLMGDARGARTALKELRELGVGIALADLGTGRSSLTYLRQLPISTIKVDGAFVQHIASRSDDLAITASIIDLGRAMDVRSVAEGVETVEQLALLHRLGCVAAQGFLWSPAITRDELAELVRSLPGRFQPAMSTPNLPWSGRRDAGRVTNEHGLHRIWQLHRDGASLTTIAAALNASDFHTPSGQRWHATSVARVIAGPAYGLASGKHARATPPLGTTPDRRRRGMAPTKQPS